jgi:hypothetical protein
MTRFIAVTWNRTCDIFEIRLAQIKTDSDSQLLEGCSKECRLGITKEIRDKMYV